MKILLIDCDWEEGVTLSPNPWLLKTSSYFKQAGHSVDLSRGDPNPSRYNLIFVFKEKNTDYLPNVNILNDSKTRLVGSQFKRYPNRWEPSESVYRARPDYYVYQDKHLTEQNYAVLSYKGRLITPQSFIKNEKNLEETVVIDNIWTLSDEDLIVALESLKKYPRVHFLHPINFLRFNEEIVRSFVKISLSKRAITSEKISERYLLIEVLKSIKSIRIIKHINLEPIGIIAATPSNHSSERFQECIQMIADANKAEVKVNFLVPNVSFEERSLFDYLTNYNQEVAAFFRFILSKELRMSPEEVINKLPVGTNFTVDLLTAVYNNRFEIYESGSVRWGGSIDPSLKKIGEKKAL